MFQKCLKIIYIYRNGYLEIFDKIEHSREPEIVSFMSSCPLYTG